MIEGWKHKTLGELLDKDEILDVELLIREKDWTNLRIYLNKRKDKLMKNGILADYLFYYLQAKLK